MGAPKNFNLENFSSKIHTRKGLFVKKNYLGFPPEKCFIRDFQVNFYQGFSYKIFYKGFPYKMNRAKIKGNSFIKETKKGKKERMEEKKERKKDRNKEKKKKSKKGKEKNIEYQGVLHSRRSAF